MTSGFFNALTPLVGGIGRSTHRRVAVDSSAPTPSAKQALIPLALLGAFAGSASDYVPTYTNPATFDACGAVGVGSILNIIGTGTTGTLGSGAGTLQRADNAIRYFLPANLGGLYGSIMAMAGEGNTPPMATTATSAAVSATPPARWKWPVPTAEQSATSASDARPDAESLPVKRVGTRR